MKLDIKQIYDSIRVGGSTLRKRFLIYVISATVTCIALLLLLLSIFGIMNPTKSRIENYIDNQLDSHTVQIEHDVEKTAAYSLSLSKELETVINDFLVGRGMSFDELKNNVEALTELQKQSYATVYTSVRSTSCSGAFYVLNTTVNDTLDLRHSNGIYIKFANLYSENTVNTKVSLFRGASEVARDNGISLYSTWQNEMLTDAFDNINVFEQKSYDVSNVVNIPDTWERARYIYSPIYIDGQIKGICGFELSDLYMQLSYSPTDTESAHAIYALLDKTENGYTGQLLSNRSGFIPPACDEITVKHHNSFNEYQCGSYTLIGKEKELTIDANPITVAMMLPKVKYVNAVLQGQTNIIVSFLVVMTAALCICLWLSKKYITPILKSVSRFKAEKGEYTPSGIAEIDDVISFLAEQERQKEEAFELEKKQMQASLDQASSENDEARRELARLAYSRKSEVDPENYQQFLAGVKTLTPMEKTVFDYYVDGKTVKDVVGLLNVKETTVRFHNRNIYSKLGVNSLKQLLLYATIMKRDEN